MRFTMETQKQFSTRTDQRWYAAYSAVIFLFLILFFWRHYVALAP